MGSFRNGALATLILLPVLTVVLPAKVFLPQAVAGLLDYPEARRVEQVDVYHSVEVHDPYRWMEAPSEDLDVWIDKQQQLLNDYTTSTPVYKQLLERVANISTFDSHGTPVRRGNRYFSSFTPAGAAKPQLLVQDGLHGEARVYFDAANAVPEEERNFGGANPSWDGQHVVWANMSQGRWGWMEILRVDKGEMIDERIYGIAGNSSSWRHDGRGFYYLKYGDPEELESGEAEPKSQILYHQLGTSTAQDRVIFERPSQPAAIFSMKMSDDGRFLVVELFDGSRSENEVHLVDLTQEAHPTLPLIAEATARYRFEGNDGDRLFFYTTSKAPRGRLIAIHRTRPEATNWQEVIAERQNPITNVSHIHGRLVVRSTKDARPVVEVFSLEGKRQYELKLPSIGLIGGFTDDPDSPVTFYRFNSLYDPGTVYRADLRTGKSEIHRRPELAHDPENYVLNQVFYESKDGTRVPMFVAHRKDLKLDGRAPAFMYAFGSGGWVAFPWFQPHLVAWLDLGGVYALPNVRGGGEYGKEWQEAGTGLNKQNAIDDYLMAAEWLIDNRYTTAARFVANGGSGSGVLPAAAFVQRPDLFGAAVIDFPFLDMFRYHKFTTVKGWTRSYGSSDVREEFEVLAQYSPMHNLDPDVCYPAVLTIVGEKDASTVPMHGYKFTAALQHQAKCDQPYLIMSIPDAGHYSYGVTRERRHQSQAQMLAFMIRALGLDTHQFGMRR